MNPNLIENTKQNLIVESLKPSHLPMLALTKKTNRLGWMQIMLLKTWLSEAEVKFQGILPTRQPKCLVALEEEQLIALVVLQPNNRKGSSWSISLPEFIKDPIYSSKSDVCSLLLKTSIHIQNKTAHSWLIKCPNNDIQQLSISRELGFQPLKIINNWSISSYPKYDANITNSQISKNLSWEVLSKQNARLLLRLKLSCDSVQLRELIDRQWIDLTDRNEPKNRLLIHTEKNNQTAILGLITPVCSEDLLTLELIRDYAWDSRLNQTIPELLKTIATSQPKISLETSSDDIKINKILTENGWKVKNEKILLGRSSWKRKVNKISISDQYSLDKILRRLKPNQPPLPTPHLDIK